MDYLAGNVQLVIAIFDPEFKAKKHRLFPDERIIRIYEY